MQVPLFFTHHRGHERERQTIIAAYDAGEISHETMRRRLDATYEQCSRHGRPCKFTLDGEWVCIGCVEESARC